MEKLRKIMGDSIAQLKVDAQELSPAQSEEIWKKVFSKYSTIKNYSFPFWDNLNSYASIYDRDGWKMVGDYPSNKIILFFENRKEKSSFVFDLTSDIPKVLSEMHGFVFYLTNFECDFLLCFNDHDYLIGAGEALDWVKQIKQ